MTEKTKRSLVWIAAFVMTFQVAMVRAVNVLAFDAGDVVINEVAWAGSSASSNDEWIELYNTSNVDVDLSGWTIVDDGSSSYAIDTGTIPAHGYFLIEDSEESIDLKADAVIGLSLANAGDSLVLKNPDGAVVDSVNSLGGAWYAGKADVKATMERIDPNLSLDSADNWASATTGNGAKARDGAVILGTPGSVNSNYGGSGPEVYLTPQSQVSNFGEHVNFDIELKDSADLYAYGFDIKYDPQVFHFLEADEGPLLKSDGSMTAFNYGLEDGNEGSLIIGNARLTNPPRGIDGSGKLVSLSFEVIAADSLDSQLSFGAASYIADSHGDVPSKFESASIKLGAAASGPIKNLSSGPGEARYSIELNWAAPTDGADTYQIFKQNAQGYFVLEAELAEPTFIDQKAIIPGVTYHYKVLAVKDGISNSAVETSALEDRGIRGDNDRNDRVDGRDIENLARAYGSEIGDEEYNPLVDTNFDGVIDGSDLIDIGASFGLSYE